MRFLGMVGYYRSFCKNCSSVVAPLTDLLKAKVKFVPVLELSCCKLMLMGIERPVGFFSKKFIPVELLHYRERGSCVNLGIITC